MKHIKRLLLSIGLFSILFVGSAPTYAENTAPPDACALIINFATEEITPFDTLPGDTFADDAGTIYIVSQSITEGRLPVYLFSATGAYLETRTLTLPANVSTEGFSVRYNRNGTLYIRLNAALYRFSLDSTYLGELTFPSGDSDWEVSRQGDLYLLNGAQIDLYNGSGTYVASFTIPPQTGINDRLITLAPNDVLYVAQLDEDYDGSVAYVDAFGADGTVTNSVSMEVIQYADWYLMQDFVVDTAGTMYFAFRGDFYRDRILRVKAYSAVGMYLGLMTEHGGNADNFSYGLNNLFIDQADNLYVSHPQERAVFGGPSEYQYTSVVDYFIRSYTYTCDAQAIPPIIGVLGENPVEITLGSGETYVEGPQFIEDAYGTIIDYIPGGAVTVDAQDGFANDVGVDSSAVNDQAAGTYFVYYTATDSDGNTTTATRTVNVTDPNAPDTTPPVLILDPNWPDAPAEIPVGGPIEGYLPSVTAYDLVDGDVSDSITVDLGNLDVFVVGNYEITYSAVDAAGNVGTLIIDADVVENWTVFSLAIVDTSTGSVVPGFGAITDDIIIDSAGLPDEYTVVTSSAGRSYGSTVFTLTGPVNITQINNDAPHALFGSENAQLVGGQLPDGQYTLTVSAHSQTDGAGLTGDPLSINLEIFTEDQVTEEPTPEITETVTATDEPTDEPTETVTATDEPTDEPSATDEPTEDLTDEPTEDPTTETPVATDEPTVEPTETVVVITEEPEATPEPTETVIVITQEPTPTAEVTETPLPSIRPDIIVLSDEDTPVNLLQSTGNPIYVWADTGAESYQFFLSGTNFAPLPFGNAASPNTRDRYVFEILLAADVCQDGTCQFDPTTVTSIGWLTNGAYEVWMCDGNSDCTAGVNWRGPFGFTMSIPSPDAPTQMYADSTTLTWELPGNAINTGFFRVYLAPTNDIQNPVVFQWFTRPQICGDWMTTTCDWVLPTPLIEGVEYTLYVQPWSPGGFIINNIQGWAGPDIFSPGN